MTSSPSIVPSATATAPVRGSVAAGSTVQAGSDLALEMRRRWRIGERPSADEFLASQPELMDQPEAAVELVYEEFCLREAAGDRRAEQDILRRYPQWAGPLRVMLECHQRILLPDREAPALPEAGDRVGDFTLLAALGRGLSGHVFLAMQGALADRPVVLKITALEGAEHLSLARLQHTHIVPLYSVVDDPARRVRILCMPYFGRSTLASLLDLMNQIPPAARTGAHVVAAIDRMQEELHAGIPELPAPAHSGGAARQMLMQLSWVQALCWMTSCLADALHFAHERGVVHLDLKPSNILLASDGQPMLLDFHLARAPIRPGGAPPDNFGGTPGYMPPEQQATIQALREGRPVESSVDHRADVFALGAILYESLGGALPVEGSCPPLERTNPQVSAGLSDVLAKCLATRPEDRYADAAAFSRDLCRHLGDQPLAGVPNRSLLERWHKWRRRRPGTLRATALIILLASTVLTMLAGAWDSQRHRRQQAQLALREGQRQLAEGQYAEAVQSFERGAALGARQRFDSDLQRQMTEQLASARALHVTQQTHALAEKVRGLWGGESSMPPADLQSAAAQCDAFWSKRQVLLEVLEPAKAAELGEDLQDLAIFATRVRAGLAGGNGETAEVALRILNEAEAAFGPNPVLALERQMLFPSLEAPPPRPASTPWEHYASGRALLAAGELDRALQELSAARALEPGGQWSNFYYGRCAYRLGMWNEAVAAFSVSIGTAPDSAACFHNRALAYTQLGQLELALADYDHALRLEPAHVEAAINRGMLHYQQRRFAEALADLTRALEHGGGSATVHFDLALVHMAANDPVLARRHAGLALERDPTSEKARQLLAALGWEAPLSTRN